MVDCGSRTSAGIERHLGQDMTTRPPRDVYSVFMGRFRGCSSRVRSVRRHDRCFARQPDVSQMYDITRTCWRAACPGTRYAAALCRSIGGARSFVLKVVPSNSTFASEVSLRALWYHRTFCTVRTTVPCPGPGNGRFSYCTAFASISEDIMLQLPAPVLLVNEQSSW
jgi:hypothetical protein